MKLGSHSLLTGRSSASFAAARLMGGLHRIHFLLQHGNLLNDKGFPPQCLIVAFIRIFECHRIFLFIDRSYLIDIFSGIDAAIRNFVSGVNFKGFGT